MLCPPPGDLPDLGIKPASLRSPALAGGFFTTSATWEAPSRAPCPLVCIDTLPFPSPSSAGPEAPSLGLEASCDPPSGSQPS